MSSPSPPTRAPTATELANDPIVLVALDQAWIDSERGDPVRRHEEGGWIYLNVTTGDLTVRRALRGRGSGIDLEKPGIIAGSVVVGKFHTHPNPTSEGWISGPSGGDVLIDEEHGVPDLIRAEDGTHFSGPECRRGGLVGEAGYPS
jgi:hypothetical protein